MAITALVVSVVALLVSVGAVIHAERKQRGRRERPHNCGATVPGSITDLVFLAVERYRARLVVAPELLGRAIGPRRAIARAHLVLYLADDEWALWQDSARTGGLRTPSRLVSEALASFV